MESVQIMFFVVVVVVGVVCSDGVAEKLVNKELVDSICKFGIVVVFVLSKSRKSLDFLENISFVEDCLDQVKPGSSVDGVFLNFKGNSMSLVQTIFGINLVKSQLESSVQILVVPVGVYLVAEQSHKIDSISNFIMDGALAGAYGCAQENYAQNNANHLHLLIY